MRPVSVTWLTVVVLTVGYWAALYLVALRRPRPLRTVGHETGPSGRQVRIMVGQITVGGGLLIVFLPPLLLVLVALLR